MWTRETWAAEQLKRSSDALGALGKGERNDGLFKAAAEMAPYVADGAIGLDAVMGELTAAAHAAGLKGDEVRKTIKSGLQRSGEPWYPSKPVAQGLPHGARKWMSDTAAATGEVSPLVVVWYKSLTETQGERMPWGWSDLAEAVEAPAEKLGPLWAFHDIENDSRSRINVEGGDTRAPKVRALYALALDYDHDRHFSKENVRRWWGHVQYVAHTSRSHMLEKDGDIGPRGRVIVALSRPITPAELAELRPWLLSGRFGEIGEKELKSTARCYYVPVSGELYWSDVNLSGVGLDVDAMLQEARKPATGCEEVWGMLDQSKQGVRPTVDNVATILENDPEWQGRIRWSEFQCAALLDGKGITDIHDSRIARYATRIYQCRVSSAKSHEAVNLVAHDNPIHPVRDYLDALTWDGVERLDGWLALYMGCEDDHLSAVFGRCWLIGAVARIYEPGCKMDTTLILVGGQGSRKSTALRVLASAPWFADSTIDVRNKDSYAALQGVWIFEWPELDSMRRSEATAIKAYLTAQQDHYRPAYGRRHVKVPRQTVFVGTTNEASFLNDPTGSRRFWVREVGDWMDIEGISRDRDQLWAEAVEKYRAGVKWWLDLETEHQREQDAERFRHQDPWEGPIDSWLRSAVAPDEVAIEELLVEALKKPLEQQTRYDAMRAATVLQALGYRKVRRRRGGKQRTLWTADEE